jgi:heme/copper-type cytochrome/quinol oxidase subunit 3
MILQAYEYVEASITIADSRSGSTFFVATAFNGLNVIIGTTFLLTCSDRRWTSSIDWAQLSTLLHEISEPLF